MWAFVSDYARIKILYEQGGVYMDVDVELIKNIYPLLRDKAFMGFEAKLFVNSGLISGSIPNLSIFRESISLFLLFSFSYLKRAICIVACREFGSNGFTI